MQDADGAGTLVVHLTGVRSRLLRGRVHVRISGVPIAVRKRCTAIALRPGPYTVEVSRGRLFIGGYADYGINLHDSETAHLEYALRPVLWLPHKLTRRD